MSILPGENAPESAKINKGGLFMSKTKKRTGIVTGAEKASYGLYFFGQNVFYMLLYLYMNTYFTDVGISAAAVAGIALVVKVWDAVNDPLFGGIVDKVKFKKGKFVPWLRISLVGIPLSTILIFSIPTGISPVAKIVWAVVGYVLWDTAYTICDVPIFGLVTTMTDDQNERTTLNALGRVCGLSAAIIVAIIIPVFRNMLGGWSSTVIMLSLMGALTMLPICITAKERTVPKVEEQQDVGLKEMFTFVKGNKYLLIFFSATLLSQMLNVSSVWSIYIARYCVGDESVASIATMMSILPSIIFGMIVPALARKVDKFKLYYIGVALTLVTTLCKFFIDYTSVAQFTLISVVCAIPMGLTTILMFMFTPDCAEYGHYKSGISAPGISFSIQTFFTKLQSALVTAMGSLLLVVMGFVEGENAVQAEGFASRMWNISVIAPVIGMAIALVILHFYKLNDHDVQLMAKVNCGEMSREEAEAQMIHKY